MVASIIRGNLDAADLPCQLESKERTKLYQTVKAYAHRTHLALRWKGMVAERFRDVDISAQANASYRELHK